MTLFNPFEGTQIGETDLPKVKIYPSVDPNEFGWQCPKCKIANVMMKSDVGENHRYLCVNDNCDYAFVIGHIPDSIKHFLKDKDQIKDINQRPRIVRQ
tara:strand:- start:726 stop:1019 length:294 start_codon:yes stop_codon:yes gene_type:complete